MSTATITIDCDEIRSWAEERGGKPAAVAGTSRARNDPGVLRIEFLERSGNEKLVPITWDRWCAKFEKERLAMVLQDRTAEGEPSYFNKLVSRDEFLDLAEGKRKTEPMTVARRHMRTAGRTGRGARATTGRPAARTQERAGKRTAGTSGAHRGKGARATSSSKARPVGRATRPRSTRPSKRA